MPQVRSGGFNLVHLSLWVCYYKAPKGIAIAEQWKALY